MKLVLETKSDLHQAERLVSWMNRPPVDQVLIRIPWLDGADQQRTAKTIKFYFNDCGCLWGALVFVLVLTGCLWMEPWGEAPWWIAPAYALLASVPAAIAAKLSALAWSWWRLKVLIGRIMHAETRSMSWR
jgi:hypothetical protein